VVCARVCGGVWGGGVVRGRVGVGVRGMCAHMCVFELMCVSVCF